MTKWLGIIIVIAMDLIGIVFSGSRFLMGDFSYFPPLVLLIFLFVGLVYFVIEGKKLDQRKDGL